MSRANGFIPLVLAPFPGNDSSCSARFTHRVELDFDIGQCFLCRQESKGAGENYVPMMKMVMAVVGAIKRW